MRNVKVSNKQCHPYLIHHITIDGKMSREMRISVAV